MKTMLRFLWSRLIALLTKNMNTPPLPPPRGLEVALDAVPVVTAGLNVAGEALKLGLTIEQYKNTPQYLAALQAQREQTARDTDEQVAIRAAAGDPRAVQELERRSS